MISLNNKRFTNKIILPFVFICVLISCKKDEPQNNKALATIDIQKGDGQTGLFGEILKDSIVVKVTRLDTTKEFVVKAEAIQGNGYIEELGFNPNWGLQPSRDGTVKFRWRLGCNSEVQKIKLLVYIAGTITWPGTVPNGVEPVDSVIVTASGKKPEGWARACGYSYNGIFKTNIITHDKAKLFLVSAGGLYSSLDKGVNWEKVQNVPHQGSIVDAQFNSQGWLYILTKESGIHYSKNMAQWEAINHGILDMRDPTGFLVEDSTLFVSFYFDGPYKTENNGAFWRKLLVNYSSQRYHFFTRHPNGSIYLVDDWHDMWTSNDGGKKWHEVALNFSPSIYDFKIDKSGKLYLGAGDAQIAIISPGMPTEFHRYYEWNGSSQSINNIQFFNNDVFYLVNHTPNPGLYSKNNNWGKVNLNFNKSIGSYYIKEDGNFLLLSNDGIYYRN